MPTFPSLRGGSVIESGGANLATSGGTVVTSNASANTKGTWTELLAATAYEANSFYIFLRGSTGSYDVMYDIGIGAAASEQVVVPNLTFTAIALRVAAGVYIPLRVPKGSRISIRGQISSGSSQTCALFTIYLIATSLLNGEGFSRAVNMGANTADSGGTSVDPGGTINTKGSYSQLSAATVIEIGWLVICITGQANTATTTNVGLVDIAIGGAGSEQVIIANLAYCVDAAIDSPEPQYYGFPVSIPKGSRVAARAQCSTNDATDRLIDINLIGLG